MKKSLPVPQLCSTLTCYLLANQLLAEPAEPQALSHHGLLFGIHLRATHVGAARKVRHLNTFLHLLAVRVEAQVYWFLAADHARGVRRTCLSCISRKAWQPVEATPLDMPGELQRLVSAETTDVSTTLKEKLELRTYPPVAHLPPANRQVFSRMMVQTIPVPKVGPGPQGKRLRLTSVKPALAEDVPPASTANLIPA